GSRREARSTYGRHRDRPGQWTVSPRRSRDRSPDPGARRRAARRRRPLMLSLPPAVRIWLAAQPADLRKSFDSLAALVRDGRRGYPLSGDIFVFRNKAADRIKLLVWEEDGYAIWYKKHE